ncbi:hypothetical protein JW859_13870 [bacterium]|nr:hypothetical protein [bacterium]
MAPAKIHTRDGLGWHAAGGVHTRGRAFRGDRLLHTQQLGEHLRDAAIAGRFAAAAAELNGFFSCIVVHDGAIYATVDHARSMPLFYALVGGQVYLSDDAAWIAEQFGGLELDPACEQEYALAGYVTGPDTLDRRIKQLQAGEALTARDGGIETARWFRYSRDKRCEYPEEELAPRLDAALGSAFDRLVAVADGRTIAVPLSGGYDSRSIVLLLKERGYANVLAFSYGRAGNHEAEASRRLAAEFGLAWEFVPYTERLWHTWFNSEERRAYYALADNLASLPILQDWPAVWELKRRGVLPADALLVPGYSADAFPASRRRPPSSPVYQNNAPRREVILDAIYNYTYFLWDWSQRRHELAPLIDARILAALGELDGFCDSAAAIEAWGIQERQAKFITNAVRCYEHWGYDWWLPLWDRQFVDFWTHVAPAYRAERRFARTHIARMQARITGAEYVPPPDPRRRTTLQRSAAWLRGVGERIPPVAAVYNAVRARAQYATHPLAWHGMIPRELFLKLYRGRVHINSFLALERLGRLSFEPAARPGRERP